MIYHEPTSGEKTILRSAVQGVQLFLAYWTPHIIFTARINQTFTSSDLVRSFAYNNGVGTYSDVKPGMTVWVGSAPGLKDIGQCRVRAITSNSVTIREVSDIGFANGQYLTFVDAMSIDERPIRIVDNNILVDGDVDYTDQHTNPDPVPVLGGPLILWKTGASISKQINATDSWIIRGSIASYQFNKIYGTGWTISNATTSTPTLNFTSTGQFLLGCTLTSAAGKSFTAYRQVWVFNSSNKPISEFKLTDCFGDYSVGGWQFTVDCFAADTPNIDERTMMVLFAKDYYNNQEISLGSHAGRENIVAVGWIENETIIQDVAGGRVKFTAQGPHWWLKQIPGWPKGTVFVTGTPTEWTEFQNQVTRDGIYEFIHNRTTADMLIDVYCDNDGLRNAECSSPASKLWEQLVNMTTPVNMMVPACDKYGRLIIQHDANLLLPADRGSIPDIMTLSKLDWLNPLEFAKRTKPEIAQLDFSGVSVDANGVGIAIFTYANGRARKQYGDVIVKDKMLLANQADSNRKAGLLMGKHNNPYPEIPIALRGNNRFFDIAPQMYATLNVAAEDNLRGVEYNGKAIPRRVELNYDGNAKTLNTIISFEAVTQPEISTVGDDPEEPADPTNPTTPTDPEPPDPEPPLGTVPVRAVIVRTPNGVFWTPGDAVYGFNTSSPTWMDMTGDPKVVAGFELGDFIKQISADRYGSTVYARAAKYLFCRNLDPANFLMEQGLLWWKTNTWLVEQVNDTDAGFTDVSTNPATGEVFVIAGSTNIFNRRKYTFRGVDGGDLEKTMLTELGIFDSAHAILADGKVHVAASSIYGGFYTYFSPDDGENWQDPIYPVPTSPPVSHTKTHQVGSSQIIYSLDYPGLLQKSEDGGENWSLVYTFDDWRVGPFGAASDGVLLCWKAGGLLLRSTDGGSTWGTVLDTNNPALISPPAYAACTYLFPLGNGIWIGIWTRSDTHIYVSFDDGSTWEYRHGTGISGGPQEIEVLL